MTTKENNLFEEIERIHVKATEIRRELTYRGLDSIIEEQERSAIATAISNEILEAK